MRRVEIIANKSVEAELMEAIERTMPELRYTVIPEVHGKGKTDRKLGTVTWPELNFALFSHVDDDDAKRLSEITIALIRRFPNEGIKFFVTG
jgi:hypothetical protein